MVIKQVTREYKCIKEILLKYFVTETQLLEYFEVADIKHVPRNEKQEASDLAQIASRYKMSKSKFQDIIEVRENTVSDTPPLREYILDRNDNCDEGFDEERPKDFGFERGHGVFTINNSLPIDWRKPILEYLENPVGSTDRKIKYRALSTCC